MGQRQGYGFIETGVPGIFFGRDVDDLRVALEQRALTGVKHDELTFIRGYAQRIEEHHRPQEKLGLGIV